MKIFWGLDSLSVNIIYLKRLIATRMALYASDGDEILFAPDAEVRGSYRCLECHGPVKVRRSRNRFPHFYHLQRPPRCRLYSKSEDHLLVQLQLQKALGGSAQIESRVPGIQRISDLLWEKERLAFEIQCSLLETAEAKQRISDYGQSGFRIVWLLDDRIFNKRAVRPVEAFLRTQICYFFSFHRDLPSLFYDQLEIIIRNKRLRKSRPLSVRLNAPRAKPFLEWPKDLPSQALARVDGAERYFLGDLLSKIIRAAQNSWEATYLNKWTKWEIELLRSSRRQRWLPYVWTWYVIRPYDKLLDYLLLKTYK